VGYPKGVFWNGLNRVRMEGHVLSSQVISYNSTLTDFANRVLSGLPASWAKRHCLGENGTYRASPRLEQTGTFQASPPRGACPRLGQSGT